MNLREKRILITGAGTGIGRATAMLLAGRGARLVLLGRRPEPLDALRAELPGAVAVAGDVADGAVRSRVVQAALDAFGGLDILVNNAGVVRAGRLEATSEDEIRAMIEIDLLAPILLTREALPHLRASGDAAVVNVTSTAALMGMPFYATYGAAKAGLARFGEALRRELLGEGIPVMTIHPAATDTPMMATNQAGADLGFVRESPEAVAEALVTGLEGGALEVVRGGEVRAAMLAANREHPEKVDAQVQAMKPRLEAAVAGHKAL